MIKITHWECQICGNMVPIEEIINHPHKIQNYKFGRSKQLSAIELEHRLAAAEKLCARLQKQNEILREGLRFYVVNGNECGIWDNERNNNDWGGRASKALALADELEGE